MHKSFTSHVTRELQRNWLNFLIFGQITTLKLMQKCGLCHSKQMIWSHSFNEAIWYIYIYYIRTWSNIQKCLSEQELKKCMSTQGLWKSFASLIYFLSHPASSIFSLTFNLFLISLATLNISFTWQMALMINFFPFDEFWATLKNIHLCFQFSCFQVVTILLLEKTIN